jgi:hypothetical protein
MRKTVGYIFFALSILAWGAMGGIQFLRLTPAQNVSWMSILFIFGEITFYFSIVLLGKEFWEKIKNWIEILWKKIKISFSKTKHDD